MALFQQRCERFEITPVTVDTKSKVDLRIEIHLLLPILHFEGLSDYPRELLMLFL